MGYSDARCPSSAAASGRRRLIEGGEQVGLFDRPDQPWRAPRGETTLCGVVLFVVLMAIWLLNSGHYTPLLTGFGVASSLFVVYLSWRMGIVDREGLPVHLIPRGLLYGPWLFKEIFTANFDVAKRVLTPYEPDISPRVFDTGVTQKSDLGRVADGLLEGEMDRRVTWLEGED
jgi:hypothetical protein